MEDVKIYPVSRPLIYKVDRKREPLSSLGLVKDKTTTSQQLKAEGGRDYFLALTIGQATILNDIKVK